MFAQLGEVPFEFLNFADAEGSHEAVFAKLDVLKGKPRLQAFGAELARLRFTLRLHWKLGDVDKAHEGLLGALEKQEPLSLVYGSGRFAGWWVLERLQVRTTLTDGKGRVAAREVEAELLEFAGDPNNPLPAPAVLGGGVSSVLEMLPETLKQPVSEAMKAVETGVKVFNTVRRHVEKAGNLIQAARDLGNDPAGWLHLAGDALKLTDGALGDLGKVSELSGLLGGLEEGRTLLRCCGQAADFLGDAAGSLRQGLEGGSALDWLDGAAGAFTSAQGALDNGTQAAAALSALRAARGF